MPVHPPWLRFQAYVVGLPKTGSTSMATLFGNYRSGHEWQLNELLELALARRRGTMSDREFAEAAGRRLVPASLEMNSATCHHLYLDFLIDRFPHAVFFHTIRDVLSWTTSLLDMVLWKRLTGRMVPVSFPMPAREILREMTGGTGSLDPDDEGDDRSSLLPLMRFWTAHMRETASLLPADRSLQIRTREIPNRLPEIAALAGIPVATLRQDWSHSNRSAHRFDRFRAFDSEELRGAYDRQCASHMADLFPSEHAAWMDYRTENSPREASGDDWNRYRSELLERMADAARKFGPRITH